MSIQTVEDALLADAIDWIGSVTQLDDDSIVPSSKGRQEQSVPAPDEPFVMVTFDPLNVPVGAQPEFIPADGGAGQVDQTRRWKMRATLQTQGFGLASLEALRALPFHMHATEMALRPRGGINDLSQLSEATDRHAQYALDFQVSYELERVTETVEELQALELSSSFGSQHEGDLNTTFTLNL